MSIERSEKGKKAKAVFFRQFNDIDIYIEDTAVGSRKLYGCMFGRAFGGRYRIETVFPLGGRPAVLDQCARDQLPGGRLRLYVIDGDLDMIAGRPSKNLKRLFSLTRYCIENYFVDEEAIISILDEENTDEDKEALRRKFGYQQWVQETEGRLFKLFVLYSLVHEKAPMIRTVSYPIRMLVSSNRGEVDSDKVSSREAEMIDAIRKVMTEVALFEELDRRLEVVRERGDGLLRYISGKHYLMPLIRMRMRATTQIRSENGVLHQRLAMRCDVSELAAAEKYLHIN